jgi:type IV pilus assembly protein PilO
MALDDLFKFEDKPMWQAAVTGLVLAGLLVGVAEWQFFAPRRRDIDAAKAKYASLSAEIEKGRAAERKLAQFREEVKKLELELHKLLQVLPPERDTEDLIKKVEALVHQGDFSLLVFRTNEPVPKEFYKEYPFNIVLNGTYHNLALFFSRMANFSRIINVEDLRIHGINAPGKTLNATFVAKTFIYTGDETQPAAPAPGNKKPPAKGNVQRGAAATQGKEAPTE